MEWTRPPGLVTSTLVTQSEGTNHIITKVVKPGSVRGAQGDVSPKGKMSEGTGDSGPFDLKKKKKGHDSVFGT